MRTASPFRTGLLLLLLAVLPACGAQARTLQGSGPEDLRIGVSFGGISFIGFVMEYRWGNQALDLTVGTFGFRDLSVSLVGKQYFGPGDFRPFSGLGLWAMVAPHHGPREQTGVALVVRAPVGVDWNLGADHHLGASMGLNRALWIRRKDPLDDTPPTDRIIPLPGFYYRWRR
ncbi:MAG: hypothetical protein ACQET1_08345 [Gemmatimonadota bacterium]